MGKHFLINVRHLSKIILYFNKKKIFFAVNGLLLPLARELKKKGGHFLELNSKKSSFSSNFEKALNSFFIVLMSLALSFKNENNPSFSGRHDSFASAAFKKGRFAFSRSKTPTGSSSRPSQPASIEVPTSVSTTTGVSDNLTGLHFKKTPGNEALSNNERFESLWIHETSKSYPSCDISFSDNETFSEMMGASASLNFQATIIMPTPHPVIKESDKDLGSHKEENFYTNNFISNNSITENSIDNSVTVNVVSISNGEADDMIVKHLSKNIPDGPLSGTFREDVRDSLYTQTVDYTAKGIFVGSIGGLGWLTKPVFNTILKDPDTTLRIFKATTDILS